MHWLSVWFYEMSDTCNNSLWSKGSKNVVVFAVFQEWGVIAQSSIKRFFSNAKRCRKSTKYELLTNFLLKFFRFFFCVAAESRNCGNISSFHDVQSETATKESHPKKIHSQAFTPPSPRLYRIYEQKFNIFLSCIYKYIFLNPINFSHLKKIHFLADQGFALPPQRTCPLRMSFFMAPLTIDLKDVFQGEKVEWGGGGWG